MFLSFVKVLPETFRIQSSFTVLVFLCLLRFINSRNSVEIYCHNLRDRKNPDDLGKSPITLSIFPLINYP